MQSEPNKAIAIHTRKEAITIFDQLRNKINIAYQSLTDEAFEGLLTVIKVIYYLHPMPKFLAEINQIGSLPVTVFLQNLLIKTSMTKLSITRLFRTWVINLILKFKQLLPQLKTDSIKELRSSKSYELIDQCSWDVAISFAIKDLNIAVKKRDIGLVAVLVHFLRVIVLNGERKKQITISKDDERWRDLIENIVEGTKVLDNLKRQEIAVCLCYYLCLRDKALCEPAISRGIVQYLVSILNRRFISVTFGKKIIDFLKYLLLRIQSHSTQLINISLFEKALALFSSRFDREEIILSIRDLVGIFQQKISAIDYQQKLQALSEVYQQYQNHKIQPQQFFEVLHIINLYIHNDRMGNVVVKFYPSLLSRILHQQKNPQVVKMLSGYISFNFKRGKLKEEAALQVIAKIDEVISSAAVRDVLLENRKQFLIDFVKILKTILENREYHDTVTWAIKTKTIENKLWDYSDCTNYMYEKQLIELRRMLEGKDSEHTHKEVEVLKRLEGDIINKSKFNVNKLSWELFQEVKFLEHLLNDNGTIPGFKPSAQIPVVVSNYIQTSTQKCTFSLLQNIQNEQSEQLRKEFNLVCCKLLTKLLKNKKQLSKLSGVKEKMIALTASKDEIEDIYDMVTIFIQNQEEIQEEFQKRQSTIRASKMMQQQLQKQIQFTDKVRQILHQFFRSGLPFDISLLKVNDEDELQIFMDQLDKYENEDDILQYLSVVFQLSKKDNICGSLYQLMSQKLLSINQALSSRQNPGDQDVVVLIDSIILRFLRFHLKCLFNDLYDSDTVAYYMQYVGQIDEHFEFGFNQKRIQLLQLIIEYLECNMVECNSEYEKLIKKEDRSQFIRSYIDSNKAEAIGLSYGKLLSLNFDDEVHQAFWMQHKQHLLRGLQLNQNTPYLKFLHLYVAECQSFIFKEYQLQNFIESAIDLFIKECDNAQSIYGNLLGGVLKLRKIKYFSLLLHAYIQREDLKANNNFLYSQEEVLVKALILLLQSTQHIPNQSFKRFYIEQIIVTLLKTLSKLYRLNFINKEIRGESLSRYFDKLMEISNEDAINCVCSLMRAFLLKKFVSMAECTALRSCYQFADSLPLMGQEHIHACMRIEDCLANDMSLDQEAKLYFSEMNQEDNSEDFQKFAKNMLQEQEIRKATEEQGRISLESGGKGNTIQQSPAKQQENDHKEPQSPQSPFKIKPLVESEQKLQVQVIIEQLESKWSEQELMDYLKRIVKEPAIYSIKEASLQLSHIDSLEYCQQLTSLFLKAEALYSLDTSELNVSCDKVKQSIIDHIPGGVCPLDPPYFEILQKGPIGSCICLKKKGGLKATQILSRKILESVDPKTTLHYMHNLSKNISSSNQLKYLSGIKIYETVNNQIDSYIKDQQSIVKLCEFITVTADNSSLRNSYDVASVLSQLLIETQLRQDTRLAIVQALTKLTHECHKHKQIAEKTKIIPFITAILKQSTVDTPIFSDCSNLMANVIDYSQSLVSQHYQFLSLQQLMLQTLWSQLQKKQYSALFLPCLLTLSTLSSNKQSALKIVNGRFGQLLLPICKLAIANNQPDVVSAQISILSQLTNQKEAKLIEVLDELMGGGLLQFLVESAHLVPKLKKSEMFLELLVRMLGVPSMVQRCMQKREILRILVDVLKHTQTEMVIIQKWTKVLYQLFEGSKFQYSGDILKSNLFYLTTSCIKANYFLTQTSMNLNIRLLRQLNAVEDPEHLLIKHGFAGYMVQVLRMKNLQEPEYLAILSMLKKLQQKSSMFPPHLSTKLFEIVIKNLQHHWKDHLAVKSVLLLKKIKKNVQITSEFSHNIFEFFNKFLIQSNKSNANFEYYSISRQVICLVSYFINFNDDVKLLFKSQVIIGLLKSWLKMFKSVAEDQSAQTFRLWLYSVFSNQTFTFDVYDINQGRLEEIEGRMAKGYKCNLFRLDGSYKEAFCKYDKTNQQLVAFKFPDGQVKPKYCIPLKTILFIYRYQSQDDFLLQESRFTRTFNPFQHNVNYLHCLTIFGLIQQRFQVREMSIELSSQQEMQLVYTDLKILLNKMMERQKQEQVKYWVARSSRQIPMSKFTA